MNVTWDMVAPRFRNPRDQQILFDYCEFDYPWEDKYERGRWLVNSYKKMLLETTPCHSMHFFGDGEGIVARKDGIEKSFHDWGTIVLWDMKRKFDSWMEIKNSN